MFEYLKRGLITISERSGEKSEDERPCILRRSRCSTNPKYIHLLKLYASRTHAASAISYAQYRQHCLCLLGKYGLLRNEITLFAASQLTRGAPVMSQFLTRLLGKVSLAVPMVIIPLYVASAPIRSPEKPVACLLYAFT